MPYNNSKDIDLYRISRAMLDLDTHGERLIYSQALWYIMKYETYLKSEECETDSIDQFLRKCIINGW
jgi:hypothetical protein